jgi:regulator of sirC expression with transglutaminase-like and TPR domain
MLPDSEINALIYLLDDSDKEVLNHVHSKLKSFGPSIIPSLESGWTTDLNPLQHERLEEIIHDIQFDSLTDEIKAWVETDEKNLLMGFYLISKYHYPELNFEELQKKIFKIKQSIWLELNYNQTPLEQIQIFNQVLYKYHNFKGQQTAISFQEFCLNHVLETKSGNVIAIGMLYQILANELNLPVYGVPLPKYYVVCFCKKYIYDFTDIPSTEKEVMFYINPVNKGTVFSRNEIKDYLEKMQLEKKENYFAPTSNLSIIIEYISYLLDFYKSQNEPQRVQDLKQIRMFLLENN